MTIYEDIVRPLLFHVSKDDPEKAHELALRVMGWVGHPTICELARPSLAVHEPCLGQQLAGLFFPNPVGLAAGFDKNAIAPWAWAALGFGFMELGTLTPKPQIGNDRPRIFRLTADQALINRMGFNNDGAWAVAQRLRKHGTLPVPVGVSLGKNKDIPNEQAVDDYLKVFETVYEVARFFTVNVSSPNTPGLRELQDADVLRTILRELILAAQARKLSWQRRKPIFLKLAPDLTNEQVLQAVDLGLELGIDGVILANTTIRRDGLKTVINEIGGLSGPLLFSRAHELVSLVRERVGTRMVIVAVGGISTVRDAVAMLEAGANLLQIYTSFVYKGPGIVRQLNLGIRNRLQGPGIKGVKSLAELHPVDIPPVVLESIPTI